MVSGGARESRDSVLGLPVGLNKDIMGWGTTNRGGWLVHDSNDIQAGNGAGILRSLSLVVVEVGWHGHHSINNLLLVSTASQSFELAGLAFFPRKLSAMFFISPKTIADTSSGLNDLSFPWTATVMAGLSF